MNGTITTQGQSVTLAVPADTQSVSVTLAGTFSAFVALETSIDGTNYTQVGSMTMPGAVNFDIAVDSGQPQVIGFRARGASHVTGTVNVTLTPNAPLPTQSIQGSLSITNFPAVQEISGNISATVGLPANASQENNGNLALITDLLAQILYTLRALNLGVAQLNGTYIDPLSLVNLGNQLH